MRRRMLAIPAAALLALALGAPVVSAQGQQDHRDKQSHARPARVPARSPHAVHRSDQHRARVPARAVPRARVVAPRVAPAVRPRVHVWVAPRVAPRAVIVTPRRFYGVRPASRISFGLFIGAVAPYRWVAPPRYVYGYAPAAGMAYGAVSLDMGPGDAAVYVDGDYVGQVDQFRGDAHPLALVSGRHRIDLAAPGYQPMGFYVDVAPGSLIPYQGGLQPLPGF